MRERVREEREGEEEGEDERVWYLVILMTSMTSFLSAANRISLSEPWLCLEHVCRGGSVHL